MNPYKINYKKFKVSEKITDEKDVIKLYLLAQLKEIISKIETVEILSITGLDKSDLSRIRVSNFERFSIDRLIGLLDKLGYSARLRIEKKKA
jgi:predicted XRE-type DNA-binding protein